MGQRIRVDAHRPRGPLNVYHPETPSLAVRVPALQEAPGYADPAWVALMRDVACELYVSVEAARHKEPPADATAAAQHQLIASSAAVCATEAEALACLCEFGLHRSAQIHARAIGILARNVLVFNANGDLAVSCFDSLDVSRKELVDLGKAQMEAVTDLVDLFERRFADAAGESMRKLEQKRSDLFGAYKGQMMSAYFQNAFSKWAHGDIVALADAGDALSESKDVRAALNVRSDLATTLLAVSIPYALVCYAVLHDLGCGRAATWEALRQRYEDLSGKGDVFERVDAMYEAMGIKREPRNG